MEPSSQLDVRLADFLDIKRAAPRGVGIEIELEASNDMPPIEHFDGSGWSKQVDGSLRGYASAEYVLVEPRPVGRIGFYLSRLKKILGDYGTDTLNSVRAGTHIHYDICTHTLREFFTLLTVWYTIEELLSTQFGEGRKGNHFCLRGIDAELVTTMVALEAKKGRLSAYLNSQTLRYCALNLTSLFKYGTIEFRALRGTLDDGYILRWVGILDSVVRNSKMFPNPKSVVQNLSEGGEEHFLRQILGNQEAALFLAGGGGEEMLRRGARLAQEIAYARKEW